MNHVFGTILFDLDGTLVDSSPGIVNGVRYAADKLGLSFDESKIAGIIGPPVKDAMRLLFPNFTDDQLTDVVKVFREYYSTQGCHEFSLYEGMAALLAQLSSADKKLYVATSKPAVFADKMLVTAGVRPYFHGLVGSQLDIPHQTKGQIIGMTLNDPRHVVSRHAVMVGDRVFDIEGARENNIRSIGVTYGYGSLQELQEAGANHIVHDVASLQKILTQ